METTSNYNFKYNLNEAISYRGKTLQELGFCDIDNTTIISFSDSINTAEIDKFGEYPFGDVSLCFEILGTETRKVTKEEWKASYSAWRYQYGEQATNEAIANEMNDMIYYN